MCLTLSYLCLSLTKASVTLDLLSAHWGLELDFCNKDYQYSSNYSIVEQLLNTVPETE